MLLIGTTLEVLASQGREMFRISRWRKHMGHHVVVVGYGTKGRSAVETLVNNGQDRESIVVVDPGPTPWRTRTPTGWPSSPATPPGARCCAAPGSPRPSQVIITTDRDDSNVLATLTVRQLNPDV